MRLFENILSQTNTIYKENERKRLLFSIKSYILCQTRIIRTLPKRCYFRVFGKFAFEVRIVRLHLPLPKIIENIGVLVADKSNGVFLD